MIKNTKRIFALVLAVAVVAMSMFTGVVVSATDPVQTAEGIVDLLEFGDYLIEAGSTNKFYDTNVADNGEKGDSWENAIIIDSAEEFVYLCKGAGSVTAGKYYKVADGIAGFDLSKGDIDLDGTLAENIDKIKAGGKNHSGGADAAFQGHFDGNGVTVYGAHVNAAPAYMGLFSYTKGDVTIKNINVNKAYFVGKNAAGGIVGYHEATKTAAQAKTETESSGALVLPALGSLTIENCSVTDSYIEVQGTGYGCGVGAILGYENNSWSDNNVTYGLNLIDASQIIVVSGKECYDVDGNGKNTYYNGTHAVTNCYVNLDEANFVSMGEDGTEETGERVCHGGVVGVSGSNALMVSNCVVIGIKPYATSESTTQNDVQHSGLASHFANVYTDQASGSVVIGGKPDWAGYTQNFTGKVFQLTDDQLKGTAVMDNMNLDWSIWMADVDGYPELRSMHKNMSYVDNGDGLHSEVCACGFGGVSAEHIWSNNECVCGAKLDCAGRDTIYWDGTIATGITTGSGTKDDPYIIKTASEFAWLIQQKVDVTDGKYYKIADNIGSIVLQNKDLASDILALKTADEVQAFFEDRTMIFTAWPNVGWESSCFAGVFDGNGATVYGLYQSSSNNAGLFSTIDAGAVIKNIALKNSYITSTVNNYQVGGLAAVTSGIGKDKDTQEIIGYGKIANGAIWFDSCVVANNYMYNPSTSHDRTGVIIGGSTDMLYIDNCLVYGNNATYGDNVIAPIWSNAQNSEIVNSNTIVPEGLELVNDGAETPRYYNKLRNSVIMGATPYDHAQQVGSRFNDPKCFENVYSDAAASTFFSNISDDQIKQVTVGELATLKLGDAWLNTTTYPDLKVFHDADLPITSNDNGTHGSVCSCDTVFTAPCTFVDGTCSVCDAKMTCATKRTIYWNGAVATGFADTSLGTKDDPIIISSAEELAYLISSKADVTKDKYFEIAEDIGTIVLQSQDLADDILALDSAAATQAFFEDRTMMFKEWPEKSWEQSCFAGNFDGNGVNIYGLYQDVNSNAGLFSTIDAGAAIHNVAVLNSYMVSHGSYDEEKGEWANYQVGAIAAVTSGSTYGVGEAGVVWFNGCTVGNCYMRNESADVNRSGVIFGAASSDSVAIDNCLVYGNDAYHSVTRGDYSVKMSLYAAVSNSIVAPARVPEGLDAKTQEDTTTGTVYYYNSVRNTIAFGTDLMNTNAAKGYRRNDPSCFENNYTDGAAGTVTFGDGSEWTYEETQIKAVTLETLNDNDLGDAWIKTAGYPELKAAHIADVNDNGDGTHSVSCPCGAVVGEAEKHNFKDGACDVCGAACVHVEGEAVEENRKEPSCEGNGSYESVVYCTVCGGVISRDTTVIPGGHQKGEAVKENIVEATCSVPASYESVVYCTVCEEQVTRETITGEIDPDNHTYVDGFCKDCSAEKPVIAGDADGDGKLNAKDAVILIRFINGWDVEVDKTAADFNNDGKVNSKDYVWVLRYLNGWEI